MKKIIPLIFACLIIGCQKVELSESKEGRNAQEEQSDSTSVTPTLDAENWEGTIDAGFQFG